MKHQLYFFFFWCVCVGVESKYAPPMKTPAHVLLASVCFSKPTTMSQSANQQI